MTKHIWRAALDSSNFRDLCDLRKVPISAVGCLELMGNSGPARPIIIIHLENSRQKSHKLNNKVQ